MVNYDARWNNGGHVKYMVLRVADTKQVIVLRKFMNEEEFDKQKKDLLIEQDRWYASDQFIGRFLEVVVI